MQLFGSYDFAAVTWTDLAVLGKLTRLCWVQPLQVAVDIMGKSRVPSHQALWPVDLAVLSLATVCGACRLLCMTSRMVHCALRVLKQGAVMLCCDVTVLTQTAWLIND